MLGHDMGGPRIAYPELGFGDRIHSLTHHQGDTGEDCKKVLANPSIPAKLVS